jgi:hypothetical protein
MEVKGHPKNTNWCGCNQSTDRSSALGHFSRRFKKFTWARIAHYEQRLNFAIKFKDSSLKSFLNSVELVLAVPCAQTYRLRQAPSELIVEA